MIAREEITTLLERPRAVTFAYVDGRGPEPQVIEEQRRDAVTRRLREAGAPDGDARAIEDALEREPGLPAPSSRYVLAEDGEIILDESLPGPRSGPELLGHSMLPPVLPLLRDRTDGIRYLVVEAGRGSAEVRVERAGREPEWAETIEGRTDALPKVSVGGWSQANYQRSSEQIWKQNEADVAELVDALTQQHSPEFIVISGDIRARQLLIDQLGVAARKLVIVVDSHTHAAGADRESLDRAIEEAIQDHLQRSEDAVDTAASEAPDDQALADSGRWWRRCGKHGSSGSCSMPGCRTPVALSTHWTGRRGSRSASRTPSTPRSWSTFRRRRPWLERRCSPGRT
jgi:hypothetical protein